MGTTGTSQPERAVCLPARDSSATVRACRRTDSGYTTEFGPDYGHVGRNGVSANKREGDLRTPRGVFPLRGGPAPMPTRACGSAAGFGSSKPADGRWDSAEKLLNQPAYNYAQVIGYNEGRTPGRDRPSSSTSTRAAAPRDASPFPRSRCWRSCAGNGPGQ